MIVIIGESASGKTTLQKKLIKNYPQYKKIVTYTTRPKRENEIDGVDYHFVSVETFNNMITNDMFVEYAQYRDWLYGTAKEDCINANDYSVVVLTPSGLRALKKLNNDIISIYLYVDRRARLMSILNRGDNIDEAYRRNLSDVGQFDGVSQEVDYVIDNTNFHMDEDETFLCLMKIIEIANGDTNEK